MPQLPELTAGRQVPHIPHRRRKAVGTRRHVHHARVAASAVHPASLRRTQSQRLLAHYVLAVLRRRQRDRPMREIWRRDYNCVNVRIRAQLLIIGRHILALPILTPLLEQLPAGVANSAQPRALIESNGRNVVIVADGASTDDRDSDGFGSRVYGHVFQPGGRGARMMRNEVGVVSQIARLPPAGLKAATKGEPVERLASLSRVANSINVLFLIPWWQTCCSVPYARSP